MKNEIILYRPNELSEHIEVIFDDDTVWLTQAQIAELFDTKRPAITKHLRNIFDSGELSEIVVCSKMEHTTQHGAISGKTQTGMIKTYNLDAILSVGYRVNSANATQFRIWATRKLKDYLLKGYVMNTRMDSIEDRVDEIELKLNANQIPSQGIFYNGQIFDAYVFVSDLIRQARNSIVLIDNYINDSALLLLSKRKINVKAQIYTRQITPDIQLDLTKHNAQYDPISIGTTVKFHDRFLIIDDIVYHIGASLKDLGTRVFAFSKMEVEPSELLKNI